MTSSSSSRFYRKSISQPASDQVTEDYSFQSDQIDDTNSSKYIRRQNIRRLDAMTEKSQTNNFSVSLNQFHRQSIPFLPSDIIFGMKNMNRPSSVPLDNKPYSVFSHSDGNHGLTESHPLDSTSYSHSSHSDSIHESENTLDNKSHAISNRRELEALKCILKRESYLKKMYDMVLTTQKKFKEDITELLDLIRLASIDVIETVIRWRESMNDHKAVYLWNEVNYLLKMSSDLDYMDEFSIIRSHLYPLTRNPFCVPCPMEEAVPIFAEIVLNPRQWIDGKLAEGNVLGGVMSIAKFKKKYSPSKSTPIPISSTAMELLSSFQITEGSDTIITAKNSNYISVSVKPKLRPWQIRDLGSQEIVLDSFMMKIRQCELVILKEEERYGKYSRDPDNRIVPYLQAMSRRAAIELRWDDHQPLEKPAQTNRFAPHAAQSDIGVEVKPWIPDQKFIDPLLGSKLLSQVEKDAEPYRRGETKVGGILSILETKGLESTRQHRPLRPNISTQIEFQRDRKLKLLFKQLQSLNSSKEEITTYIQSKEDISTTESMFESSRCSQDSPGKRSNYRSNSNNNNSNSSNHNAMMITNGLDESLSKISSRSNSPNSLHKQRQTMSRLSQSRSSSRERGISTSMMMEKNSNNNSNSNGNSNSSNNVTKSRHKVSSKNRLHKSLNDSNDGKSVSQENSRLFDYPSEIDTDNMDSDNYSLPNDSLLEYKQQLKEIEDNSRELQRSIDHIVKHSQIYTTFKQTERLLNRIEKSRAIERKRRLLSEREGRRKVPAYEERNVLDYFAMKLQSNIRGWLGRVYTRWYRVHSHSGSIILQRYVRGWLARLNIRRTKYRNLSATKVQKLYRGWKARQLQRDEVKAVILIQKIVRGWLGRRRLIRKQEFDELNQNAFLYVDEIHLSSKDIKDLGERIENALVDTNDKNVYLPPEEVLYALQITSLIIQSTRGSIGYSSYDFINQRYYKDIDGESMSWVEASKLCVRSNRLLHIIRSLTYGPSSKPPRILHIPQNALQIYYRLIRLPHWNVPSLGKIGLGSKFSIQLYYWLTSLVKISDRQSEFLEYLGSTFPEWIIHLYALREKSRKCEQDMMIRMRCIDFLHEHLDIVTNEIEKHNRFHGSNFSDTDDQKKRKILLGFLEREIVTLRTGLDSLRRESAHIYSEEERLKFDQMTRERYCTISYESKYITAKRKYELLLSQYTKDMKYVKLGNMIILESVVHNLEKQRIALDHQKMVLEELETQMKLLLIQIGKNEERRKYASGIPIHILPMITTAADLKARFLFSQIQCKVLLRFYGKKNARFLTGEILEEYKLLLKDEINLKESSQAQVSSLESMRFEYDSLMRYRLNELIRSDSLSKDQLMPSEEQLQEERIEDDQQAKRERERILQFISSDVMYQSAKNTIRSLPYIIALNRDIPYYAKNKIQSEIIQTLPGEFEIIDSYDCQCGIDGYRMQEAISSKKNIILHVDIGFTQMSRKVFVELMKLVLLTLHPCPNAIAIAMGDEANQSFSPHNLFYGVSSTDLEIMRDGKIKRCLDILGSSIYWLKSKESIHSIQRLSEQRSSPSKSITFAIEAFLHLISMFSTFHNSLSTSSTTTSVTEYYTTSTMKTLKLQSKEYYLQVDGYTWNEEMSWLASKVRLQDSFTIIQSFVKIRRGQFQSYASNGSISFIKIVHMLEIINRYINHSYWPKAESSIRLTNPFIHHICTYMEQWSISERLTMEGGGLPMLPLNKTVIPYLTTVTMVSDSVDGEDRTMGIHGWRTACNKLIKGVLGDFIVYRSSMVLENALYQMTIYREQDRIFIELYDHRSSETYVTMIIVDKIPNLLAPNAFQLSQYMKTSPSTITTPTQGTFQATKTMIATNTIENLEQSKSVEQHRSISTINKNNEKGLNQIKEEEDIEEGDYENDDENGNESENKNRDMAAKSLNRQSIYDRVIVKYQNHSRHHNQHILSDITPTHKMFSQNHSTPVTNYYDADIGKSLCYPPNSVDDLYKRLTSLLKFKSSGDGKVKAMTNLKKRYSLVCSRKNEKSYLGQYHMNMNGYLLTVYTYEGALGELLFTAHIPEFDIHLETKLQLDDRLKLYQNADFTLEKHLFDEESASLMIHQVMDRLQIRPSLAYVTTIIGRQSIYNKNISHRSENNRISLNEITKGRGLKLHIGYHNGPGRVLCKRIVVIDNISYVFVVRSCHEPVLDQNSIVKSHDTARHHLLRLTIYDPIKSRYAEYRMSSWERRLLLGSESSYPISWIDNLTHRIIVSHDCHTHTHDHDHDDNNSTIPSSQVERREHYEKSMVLSINKEICHVIDRIHGIEYRLSLHTATERDDYVILKLINMSDQNEYQSKLTKADLNSLRMHIDKQKIRQKSAIDVTSTASIESIASLPTELDSKSTDILRHSFSHKPSLLKRHSTNTSTNKSIHRLVSITVSDTNKILNEEKEEKSKVEEESSSSSIIDVVENSLAYLLESDQSMESILVKKQIINKYLYLILSTLHSSHASNTEEENKNDEEKKDEKKDTSSDDLIQQSNHKIVTQYYCDSPIILLFRLSQNQSSVPSTNIKTNTNTRTLSSNRSMTKNLISRNYKQCRVVNMDIELDLLAKHRNKLAYEYDSSIRTYNDKLAKKMKNAISLFKDRSFAMKAMDQFINKRVSRVVDDMIDKVCDKSKKNPTRNMLLKPQVSFSLQHSKPKNNETYKTNLTSLKENPLLITETEIVDSKEVLVFEGNKIRTIFREGGNTRWHGHVYLRVYESKCWTNVDGKGRRLRFVISNVHVEDQLEEDEEDENDEGENDEDENENSRSSKSSNDNNSEDDSEEEEVGQYDENEDDKIIIAKQNEENNKKRRKSSTMSHVYEGMIRNSRQLKEILGIYGQDLLETAKTQEMVLYIAKYCLQLIKQSSHLPNMNNNGNDSNGVLEKCSLPKYVVEFSSDRLFDAPEMASILESLTNHDSEEDDRKRKQELDRLRGRKVLRLTRRINGLLLQLTVYDVDNEVLPQLIQQQQQLHQQNQDLYKNEYLIFASSQNTPMNMSSPSLRQQLSFLRTPKKDRDQKNSDGKNSNDNNDTASITFTSLSTPAFRIIGYDPKWKRKSSCLALPGAVIEISGGSNSPLLLDINKRQDLAKVLCENLTTFFPRGIQNEFELILRWSKAPRIAGMMIVSDKSTSIAAAPSSLLSGSAALGSQDAATAAQQAAVAKILKRPHKIYHDTILICNLECIVTMFAYSHESFSPSSKISSPDGSNKNNKRNSNNDNSGKIAVSLPPLKGMDSLLDPFIEALSPSRRINGIIINVYVKMAAESIELFVTCEEQVDRLGRCVFDYPEGTIRTVALRRLCRFIHVSMEEDELDILKKILRVNLLDKNRGYLSEYLTIEPKTTDRETIRPIGVPTSFLPLDTEGYLLHRCVMKIPWKNTMYLFTSNQKKVLKELKDDHDSNHNSNRRDLTHRNCIVTIYTKSMKDHPESGLVVKVYDIDTSGYNILHVGSSFIFKLCETVGKNSLIWNMIQSRKVLEERSLDDIEKDVEMATAAGEASYRVKTFVQQLVHVIISDLGVKIAPDQKLCTYFRSFPNMTQFV